MLRNTPARYGIVSKCLHWLLAAMMLGLGWLGWYMVDLSYFDPWYHDALEWHKALGVLVLAVAVVKAGWVLRSPLPELQGDLPGWQRIAARTVHVALFASTLLLPLTGYIISTSDGKGVSMFGLFDVPALLPRDTGMRDRAIELHFYLAYAMLSLACAHALAALKHQFVNRDGTLARMLWR